MAGELALVASWARQHPVLTAVLGVGSFTFLWLFKLNLALIQTPPEARKHATGSPWTEDVLRKTYERLAATPLDTKPHMPPKLDRRYIIVGASGLVGGSLVTQLLERGHPPSAIRMIDFNHPTRQDLVTGPAAQVSFIQGDMTSSASMDAAFSQPWDPSVASLPLTVLHTAAVLRAADRSPLIYDRCRIPNVVGTANVLSASKAAGASVFIFTSSSGVTMRPVTWFTNAPWRFWPHNFVQVMDDHDFFEPPVPNSQYFSNYARSKAEAERLVCAADSKTEGFRAGAIRPGNGVYGHPVDLLLGYLLRSENLPTYTAPWIQSWVNVRNLALAQLQLEAALLGPHADSAGVAGRPFVVSDPGPPPLFADLYAAVALLSKTPVTVPKPPPVVLLLVATVIEAWCNLLRNVPALTRLGLKEPGMPMYFLQPGIFDASVNYIVDDRDARRSPEEGGIGYRGMCTSMEGICMQIAEWNKAVEENGGKKIGTGAAKIGIAAA